MPHNMMVAIFGAAFFYAILAMVMGARAFWRDIAEAGGALRPPRTLLEGRGGCG